MMNFEWEWVRANKITPRLCVSACNNISLYEALNKPYIPYMVKHTLILTHTQPR